MAGFSESASPPIAKKFAGFAVGGDTACTPVITQGSQPTLVCVDGEVAEYPVVALNPGMFADTDGADDAYVGGLLSGRVQRAACRFETESRVHLAKEPSVAPEWA